MTQDLSSWTPCARPGADVLTGETVRLEPLNWLPHEHGLFAATGGEENAGLWDYVSVGPYLDEHTFQQELEHIRASREWETMVIRDHEADTILGMCSFMRIREQHGSVEIGCVVFGHALQKTRQGTDALYVMASHALDDLGYRRYEWKCDDRNAASMAAAKRFGFTYEGTFRNDTIQKGRNRDTAWFSITDAEWPGVKAALETWLEPDNVDADGKQIKRLEEVRGEG